MTKIVKLFESIRTQTKKFLGSKRGDEFENQIEYFLRNRLSLTKIDKDTFRSDNLPEYKKIRTTLRDKSFEGLIQRPDNILCDSFIFQPPFGSQNFPDFLIFTDDFVVPLEIKFTSDTKTKPVWNSWIPMDEGIYIFGSYGLSDITFFRGKDILTTDQRALLISFFDELKPIEHDGNTKIANFDFHDRGFQVYIRKAFDQKLIHSSTELNYFQHKDREKIECSVIDFVGKL